MRQSRLESSLIEECARSHGVTPRAVRTWRLKDSPKWRAWVQRRAVDQTRFPSLDFDTTSDVLTPAQEEEQALRRYGALASLCDAAIARNDNTSLQPLLRSAGEAHKLLYAIRENRTAYEERRRHLIPIAEAQDSLRKTIETVKGQMEVLPSFVAHQIDPVDPRRVEEILEVEVNRILRSAAEAQSGCL